MTVSCLRLRGLRSWCAAASPLVSPPPRHWRVTCVLAPLRSLISVCAAFSVAALLSVPAYAGWWQTEYSYAGTSKSTDGSGVTTTLDWNDPNNPNHSSHAADGYAADYWPGSCETRGMVTATLTWQPSSITDTAPHKLWVRESAMAWYVGRYGNFDAISGSHNVGIGGTTIQDTDHVENYDQVQGVVEKSYLHEVDSSSGTVTLNCSVDVSCSSSGEPYPGDDPDNPPPGYFTELSACFSYGVSPDHAHPVNFRKVTRQPGDPPTWRNPDARTPGTLITEYTWDSSTGIRADLADIQIDENVDYSGNAIGDYVNILGTDYYIAPDPPFALGALVLS